MVNGYKKTLLESVDPALPSDGWAVTVRYFLILPWLRRWTRWMAVAAADSWVILCTSSARTVYKDEGKVLKQS